MEGLFELVTTSSLDVAPLRAHYSDELCARLRLILERQLERRTPLVQFLELMKRLHAPVTADGLFVEERVRRRSHDEISTASIGAPAASTTADESFVVPSATASDEAAAAAAADALSAIPGAFNEADETAPATVPLEAPSAAPALASAPSPAVSLVAAPTVVPEGLPSLASTDALDAHLSSDAASAILPATAAAPVSAAAADKEDVSDPLYTA